MYELFRAEAVIKCSHACMHCNLRPDSNNVWTYVRTAGLITRHRSSDWIWHLANRRSRIAVEWSPACHSARQRLKRLSLGGCCC